MPNLASWTREEEKAFENAIAVHSDGGLDEKLYDKIASMIPSKTIDDIRQHYQFLVDDVGAIEAGRIPLPNYGNEETMCASTKDHLPLSKEEKSNSNHGNEHSGFCHSSGNGSKGGSKLDQERKKGIPWTEEEHRLFLLGLDKFGKGDWRSISRNFVITRTPTQVASHAQKYFIRLNSMNRDRRRTSIHDITSVNTAGVPTNQAPITGQQNTGTAPTTVGAIAANNKQRPHMGHPVTGAPAPLGMYGTQMVHPVTGAPPPVHMASAAVGTPVMVPPGHPHYHPHPHYAAPVAYMAPHPMHR